MKLFGEVMFVLLIICAIIAAVTVPGAAYDAPPHIVLFYGTPAQLAGVYTRSGDSARVWIHDAYQVDDGTWLLNVHYRSWGGRPDLEAVFTEGKHVVFAETGNWNTVARK